MSLKLEAFALERKDLFWDVKNTASLSKQAILERVVCHGDWSDVTTLISILGKFEFREIYAAIITKNRVNLRPETLNLFNRLVDSFETTEVMDNTF